MSVRSSPQSSHWINATCPSVPVAVRLPAPTHFLLFSSRQIASHASTRSGLISPCLCQSLARSISPMASTVELPLTASCCFLVSSRVSWLTSDSSNYFCSLTYWNCFKFARALALPSAVFGPVLNPPCSLHRPFANALMRQGFPVLLAKAPHRWRDRLLRLIGLELAFSASILSSIRS
jgi:hypothetical protein